MHSLYGPSQMYQSQWKIPSWISCVTGHNMHAVSVRRRIRAASRIEMQRRKFIYSHERCEIPSKPLSGRCVLLPPQSQMQRFKGRRS